MFRRPAFDIAPDPFTGKPLARVALGMSFVAACAAGWYAYGGYQLLEAAITAANAAQEAKARAAAARLPKDPQAERSQRTLHAAVSASWTRLFAAIEAASQRTNGACQLLSLSAGRSEQGLSTFTLTAVAGSYPVMLDFVQALQAQPSIGQVRLELHQTVLAGTEPTIRFQLLVGWNPLGERQP